MPWQIAYFGKNAFSFTKRCRKTTSVFRRRATQIFTPCHILRAARCLGKLLASAKTHLCLQSGVVRRRAFFDGAPLTFPPPTQFYARQRATTCHFFAIFRKNHHFFSKNKVFLCQKRQDARPVFSLFFIQIIFPATYCGCKDIYRYRL